MDGHVAVAKTALAERHVGKNSTEKTLGFPLYHLAQNCGYCFELNHCNSISDHHHHRHYHYYHHHHTTTTTIIIIINQPVSINT